jgi:hypothetical protein
MPIEVRELVIKATVEEAVSANTSATSGSKSNVSTSEEIINACVDKVLEIIKEKMER